MADPGRSWLLAATTAAAGTVIVTAALMGAQAHVDSAVASARSSSPTLANGDSYGATISSDGRSVAFVSAATNLVPGDTNNALDVFVYDRVTANIQRVSVSSSGAQASADSEVPAISADGRFVAFKSYAANLVPGDTNSCFDAESGGTRNKGLCADIFVHDRITGKTKRVNVSSSGEQANDYSDLPRISADGRYVTFASAATNLVPGDTNSEGDVFVHDRVTGRTERASVGNDGSQGDGTSYGLAPITADGRFVAFESLATNLVSGDTNNGWDVFVRDRQAGTTERVSVSSDGRQGDSWSTDPAITPGGRFVAFESTASNLVPDDTNNEKDIFVRDRLAGTTEIVSVADNGMPAVRPSPSTGKNFPLGLSLGAATSDDGRFVAFGSGAINLTGAHGDATDVFVHDRATGTNERESVSTGRQSLSNSGAPSISGDGRYVAFTSGTAWPDNASPNTEPDGVYLRDRLAGTTTLVSAGRNWAPRASRLLLRPWPARAGKLLNAMMSVSAGGEAIAGARVACAATLARRQLRAIAHSFRGSATSCAWKIPKSARGKQLSGSLTATTLNGSAVRRFAGTIR